jgi:hypothetical protein
MSPHSSLRLSTDWQDAPSLLNSMSNGDTTISAYDKGTNGRWHS